MGTESRVFADPTQLVVAAQPALRCRRERVSTVAVELPDPVLNKGLQDLLHDVLRAGRLPGTLAFRGSNGMAEKVYHFLEDSLSQKSLSKVHDLLNQVNQFKLEEKLLLYLKLSTILTNSNASDDPLRQPLNPLGNRYEIHQTIMWIKTHLEEDSEVSLPKQQVYNEYNIFCAKNSMKPLSTADFGKVMKQVYPRVRPRRLGTRGNSRYCYAGMRKKIKLEPPTLPSLSGKEFGEDIESVAEQMLGSASLLIREWAEGLLSTKFPSLYALGKYLVNNLCVDNRSLAAVCILSAPGEPHSTMNKATKPELFVSSAADKSMKLREAHFQLQQKLPQRDNVFDQEHAYLNHAWQGQQSEENVGDQNKKGIIGVRKNEKKDKPHINHFNCCKGDKATVSSTNPEIKVHGSNNKSSHVSLWSSCDDLQLYAIQNEKKKLNSRPTTSDSAILPKQEKSKNTRKRISVGVMDEISNLTLSKQVKLSSAQSKLEKDKYLLAPSFEPFSILREQSDKVPVLLAQNSKAERSSKIIGQAVTEVIANQSLKNSKEQSCASPYDFFNLPSQVNALNNDKIYKLQETSNILKSKLGSVDSDILNDYFNGGHNSHEQEEELLQYFQQSNSSSSDNELSGLIAEKKWSAKQEKVCHLRIILQENINDSGLKSNETEQQSAHSHKQQALQTPSSVLPTHHSQKNVLDVRRRVSFETNIIEHSQNSGVDSTKTLSNNGDRTIPPSPNTRRRIFNFTPISPGPHSPVNEFTSNLSSANVSPFVSPINTPVSRSRSNLQGSSASRSSQKILLRSMSCNVSSSTERNDIFIVPTSRSEAIESMLSPLTIVNSKIPQSLQDLVYNSENLECTPFLSDLASQEPLLINYPSQENLQEIKDVQWSHLTTDQEIRNLLLSERQFKTDQMFNRSQSAPLHRMVNPALLSSVSTHMIPTYFSHSVNPSTSSSVATTPVPSELNDFTIGLCDDSSYLLDVGPLTSTDPHLLVEGKKVNQEHPDSVLDILEVREPKIILQQATDKQITINDSNSIRLDPLASRDLRSGIHLPESVAPLSNWTKIASNRDFKNVTLNCTPRTVYSRSHPNTPLPLTNFLLTIPYPEDSNSSKSQPSTPIHNLQQLDAYKKSNEPMLCYPSLNTTNPQDQASNIRTTCSTSVECNIADFLERCLPNDVTEGLNSLGNFEVLQDVAILSPLFTEVAEPNH